MIGRARAFETYEHQPQGTEEFQVYVVVLYLGN